jgi:hypothetical protein
VSKVGEPLLNELWKEIQSTLPPNTLWALAICTRDENGDSPRGGIISNIKGAVETEDFMEIIINQQKYNRSREKR